MEVGGTARGLRAAGFCEGLEASGGGGGSAGNLGEKVLGSLRAGGPDCWAGRRDHVE